MVNRGRVKAQDGYLSSYYRPGLATLTPTCRQVGTPRTEAAVVPGKGIPYFLSEATPHHHVLRPELCDLVGVLTHREREILAVRTALRRPHRDPHNPGG